MRVPAFVVIGGGASGAYAVRQLLRAVAAGRLSTDRVVVVDRDPRCAVSSQRDPRVTLEVADWDDWLDERLALLPVEGHVVPYHWAPHLFLNWLARQAGRAGAQATRGEAPAPPPGVPFARASKDGDLALSYATWICPATCIEPALCPHTRERKDWSLCADLEVAGGGVLEAIVFRCLAARDLMLRGTASGPKRYLVATSSHCHALAATLDVRRPA